MKKSTSTHLLNLPEFTGSISGNAQRCIEDFLFFSENRINTSFIGMNSETLGLKTSNVATC
jgi:hypothetical protein